jgi:hypothetical protein
MVLSKRARFWSGLVAGVLVVLVGIAYVGYRIDLMSAGGQSDAYVINDFQKHKTQFVQLLGLLEASPGIGSIGKRYDGEGTLLGTEIEDENGQAVTGARAEQLLALVDQLHIKRIFGSDGDFTLEDTSSPDDGPYKALVYAANPPGPLVRTETSKVTSPDTHESPVEVYRAIGEGWYVLFGQRG